MTFDQQIFGAFGMDLAVFERKCESGRLTVCVENNVGRFGGDSRGKGGFSPSELHEFQRERKRRVGELGVWVCMQVILNLNLH